MSREKKLLASVYVETLSGKPATLEGISRRTGLGIPETRAALNTLARNGLLKGKAHVGLTPKGRRKLKVVFIGGGFEVIHPGHLHTIKAARRLGDVLVVVVARDSTIRKRKGREPVSTESQRVELLSSLREVDAAIMGTTGDIYETLAKVSPDVVALGYDQHHNENDVLTESEKRGLKVQVVRVESPVPWVKTSKILELA